MPRLVPEKPIADNVPRSFGTAHCAQRVYVTGKIIPCAAPIKIRRLTTSRKEKFLKK